MWKLRDALLRFYEPFLQGGTFGIGILYVCRSFDGGVGLYFFSQRSSNFPPLVAVTTGNFGSMVVRRRVQLG